jgi:hypothetical protein
MHAPPEFDVRVGDRLFTNSKGEPVDPGALGKVWRTGKKKADLTGGRGWGPGL